MSVHRQHVWRFSAQQDVGLSDAAGEHVAALWRVSLVSAFAITRAAPAMENECRVNPLKKAKDPSGLWICFQRVCVQARWNGLSIFAWQVKPPEPPHPEPKLLAPGGARGNVVSNQ